MSKKKNNVSQPTTEEVVISEAEQKMIDKIKGIPDTEPTAPVKTAAPAKKGNAVEIYVKNTLSKAYKGKNPLTVLADEIKAMGKEEFIELFQYMLGVFKNASDDTKPLENELKKLLTENAYIFSAKYFEFINDVLPIVKTLSKRVDFSYTPMFSQEPTPAVYGTVRKEKNGQHFIPPLKGEQQKQIIDAYLSNDLPYYAGLWLCEISNFIPTRICAEFTADTRKAAIDSAKEIRNLMVNTPAYQTALGYYYCSSGADEAIKIVSSESAAKNRIIALENERANLIQANKQGEETIQYQQAQLEDLRRRIEGTEELRRQVEVLKVRFEEISHRYTLQVGMNENLEQAHQDKQRLLENEIKELAAKVAQLTEEFAIVRKKNDELTIENGNLQSDLQTERIKLANIKEDTDKLLASSKNDTVSDFVSFIAEPINHFARAFAYFGANKEFDEMTLEICVDSLNEIVDGLKSFGILPIGEFGAVVPYNRDLHYCEGSISEGDKVQVEKIGWMLNGNVIKKADVEKVEE